MSYELVGPFDENYVRIGGWKVPFLTAHPLNGGKVALTLDDRFGLDLDVADAERVVPFIANAIAVGLGYTCHPHDASDDELEVPPTRRIPFVRMTAIDLVESRALPEGKEA